MTPRHTIFRADAVRRYMENRETSVLPRYVSPRTFVVLWIVLGLLGIGLIAIAMAIVVALAPVLVRTLGG